MPCSVRIDDQAAAHGFAANEHAESHLVAVGEGEFDLPRVSADSETRRDDVAPLSRTPGIGHPTPIPERRRTEHDRDVVALQGMHAKANPRMSIDLIRIDVPRMQRRCLGTRIELSLDGRNSKRWKRGPFAPAVDPPLGNGRMAYSRLFFAATDPILSNAGGVIMPVISVYPPDIDRRGHPFPIWVAPPCSSTASIFRQPFSSAGGTR